MKLLTFILLTTVQLTIISALIAIQEIHRSKLVRFRATGDQRAPKDYYWAPFLMNWYDAQTFCDSSDMKFLTDDTPIEHGTIIEVLDRGEGFNGWTGDAWIGGRYFPGDGRWFWNHKAGSKSSIIWNNWNIVGSGCATISNSAESYGKWNSKPCNDEYMFFCEARDN